MSGSFADPIPARPVTSEWFASDIHRRVMVKTSKEDKLATYAEWAADYDKDVRGMHYAAPHVAAKELARHIEKKTGLAPDAAVRVLDAGCGTGLTGEAIREEWGDALPRLHIVGLDYSDEMLEVARGKGVYDEMWQADLNEPVVLQGGKVDFALAAGVFLEGHCEPRALMNLLGALKEGGVATVATRGNSYKRAAEVYRGYVEEAGCEILEDNVLPYFTGDNDVQGNYLTVRKGGGELN